MDDQLIIATGLGLARNEAVVPFPNAAEDSALEDILERISSVLEKGSGPGDWEFFYLDDLGPVLRSYLVERGLMTPAFSQRSGAGRAFAIYRGGSASLEINGQDHVHLLGSRVGDHLSDLWLILNELDDELETEVTYAFDDRWGYLTARPGDAGTGLRAYMTVHVPGLMVTGRLGPVALQLISQGMALTPLWEGGGGLFQVSNKGGLGIPEERTVEAVRLASRQIAEKERAVRKMLLRENPTRVRDYIGRALGVAQQGWIVSSEEALGLISAIQVGVDMGIVACPTVKTPHAAFSLMRRIQPGHIMVEELKASQGGLDDERIDQVRARILRDTYTRARVLDRRG